MRFVPPENKERKRRNTGKKDGEGGWEMRKIPV